MGFTDFTSQLRDAGFGTACYAAGLSALLACFFFSERDEERDATVFNSVFVFNTDSWGRNWKSLGYHDLWLVDRQPQHGITL
jgi:hypothetical protein